MLYGHTASALLAPEYQAGRWFAIWQFQRGLTSSLFLLLGGFAFSVATSRHWASHVRWSPAFVRRVRRFGLFILLGYALHFPVARLADLATVSEARWRSFVAVDVLQLVGVTLIVLQVLAMAAQSRRVFTVSAFGLAAAIIAFTPFAWMRDWPSQLPAALAAYLTPATGSLFPLFPWMAFVLLGAGLGQIYSRWGAAHLPAFAGRALVVPGVAMLAAGIPLRFWPPAMFGSGLGSIIPGEVLVRVGTCLLILAAIAHLSRRLTSLPHVFGAVAQESLLIYFVHLRIVYGSVWNRGLASAYGASLNPAQTLVFVLLVIVSMVALAWYWNWFKHVRPQAARWLSFAVGGYLLLRLL
jgi:uncharacterized membrane protein